MRQFLVFSAIGITLISVLMTIGSGAQTRLQSAPTRRNLSPARSPQSRSSQTPSPQMQPTDSVLLPGIYWENDRQPLQIGQNAPDFSLPLARDCRWREANKKTPQKQIEYSIEGQAPLVLGDFVQSGQGATVVVFWAFWCDTWKDVSRYMGRMKPKLQSEKTQVLCVAVDASQQPVARRAFTNGILWYPVVIDKGSATTANWGVRRVPTLFVLDNSRRVRHVFEGFPGELPLLRAIHQARKPFDATTATDKTATQRLR